jgi:hypothetical protein
MGFCPYLRHVHESAGGGPSPLAPLALSPHSPIRTDTSRFSTDLRLLTQRQISSVSVIIWVLIQICL